MKKKMWICNHCGLELLESYCPDCESDNCEEIEENTEFTIDHRRLALISQLNRGGDEFEDLKKEVFYYDKKLKCWLSRIEKDGEDS